MADLRVTMAISDYEHTRDIVHGVVRPTGIELACFVFEVEEIFYRFTRHREWDVSELSMGKYVALKASGDETLTAIPVFPSRFFRQSSIYVLADSPLAAPEDLAGKKVGVPEWAQTAGIYARGWLVHDVGIPLRDIDWYQAGVNDPGRVEKVALNLPDGVRYTQVPDRSLTEMLLAGDLDAVMTARSPGPYERGEGTIRHLLADWRAVEEAYYDETGIFPIMHVMAMGADTFRRDRWIAAELLKAFEAAKERSLKRVRSYSASRIPIPWGYDDAERAFARFGVDYYPYGIEANHKTLDAYLQYAHEQGICARRLAAEDLFPEEVRGQYKT